MTFFSRLFSKKTDDYLAKGDRLSAAERFFDARSAYEEGLKVHIAKPGSNDKDARAEELRAKIASANRSLAGLNISEAEYAIASGASGKAAEHLELAKSLTDDTVLREKAERLLAALVEKTNETSELAVASGGCDSCHAKETPVQADNHGPDHGLSPLDYYDLLIRQLPIEMYSRYSVLGEHFACAFLAASRDDHALALAKLEEWYDGSNRDIYFYEKGMILHRLGNIQESEACLRAAIRENSGNPLPYMGLALLLIDGGRFDEAVLQLDGMIANDILAEQAMLLRGDVLCSAGDSDGAVSCYGMLLATSLARPAAEKLYGVLMQCGRQQEAAAVFKQYLKGCSGH